MAIGFNKQTVSPIAVDFGFDSLKLLQIAPAEPPQLVAAAAAQVDEEARADPASRHAAFLESLKLLLEKQPFKGRRAICSLPAYQTLIQNLQVNAGSTDSVDAQIEQHLRQRLNVDPSRMVVRSFAVGTPGGGGSSRQEVVFIAASRDAVMRYIDIARKAKLDVVGMHCEPIALLRAFAYLYRRQGDELRTTCFIDIGAADTKVVVAHGTHLAFAKAIHVAGDQFTKAFALSRGIEPAEARVLRRSGTDAPVRRESAAAPAERNEIAVAGASAGRSGIAAIEADQVPPPDSSEAAPPFAAVRSEAAGGDALDCLTDELQMCLRYHQSAFPDRPIEKVVFLGGEGRHIEICQKIARALRISAQIGDPLSRMTRPAKCKAPTGVNLREPQPGWAVPIGLCQCEANL
jgi:type IV pilus assembly protein PilM